MTLFQEWTTGQRVVFCVLALTCLITNMVYSIQAPIFPGEAHKKNVTSAEYGLVFGIFQLTQMFMSPLIGSLTHSFGVTTIFVLGILLTGLSTCAFGFLKFLPTHDLFLGSALLLRIIEAVGTSAIWVGIYTFVVIEFPGSFAQTTGALEGFNGLALTIGPFFGSVLYHLGGFLVPFVVTGGLLIITGALVYLVLHGRGKSEEPEKSDSQGTMSLLLARPSICVYMLVVIIGAVNMTFLLTLLEAYLHQFHVTPIVVGLVFLLNGFTNVVTAPLVSHLCGSLSTPEVVPFTGLVLFITGFSLMAPLPVLLDTPKMWATLTAVGLIGAGAGCSFSPGFILSVQSAEAGGLGSSSTTSQISGLWLSSFAFGAFIGPIGAGFLNHHFGFPWVAFTVICLDLIQILCLCILMILSWVTASNSANKKIVHVRFD